MINASRLASRCLVPGIALCSFGCAASAPPQIAASPPTASVQQFGALREVMREGATDARVALRDWAGPHTVAVGAVEGLDGEVTMVDGAAWVSRVRDGDIVTSGPAIENDEQATLLVASRVHAWRAVTLDSPAAGAELEAMIERVAERHGIDTSRPFPFVIDGVATALDMHVIDGFCPHGGGPATAGREPRRIALSDATAVTIVGFYARDAHGVLTHHGTSMHAHAMLQRDSGRMTGHIDSVAIQAGATLRLSERPR